MKALIIGATGATGRDLVQVLLQDDGYNEVVIFVRRSTGISNPKLTEVLTDFDKLENVEQFINGDVLFSCLGTTLKTAGSKEKQWQTDYNIPANFAEKARRNGVPRAILLSAYGATAASRIFYSKMKGSLEDKIGRLSFDQYIIFRPGLLLRKNTDRWGEWISAGLIKLLNRLGLIRKFRPMPTNILAQKLAKAPNVFPNGVHVAELDKIFEL